MLAMAPLRLVTSAVCLAALAAPCGAASPRSPALTARLASCDAGTVHAAAIEMLRNPETLREPIMLFHAAMGERIAGHNEEAAFLYLAARLRTTRQIMFERGDRPQLLGIMTMTVGPLVMPTLQADPELARRVVGKVIDWDRSTPDPVRDRGESKSGDMPQKLADIDIGLARLPDELRDAPVRAADIRDAHERAERQVAALRAERCSPGTLDPVDAEAVTTRIKREAESLVRTHPLVLEQAGGAVRSVSVGTWKVGASRLPSRLTLMVTPATGKTFYAEVDADPSITSKRTLGALNVSLACVTRLWKERDSAWKDVCASDQNAIKP